ncbi:MAG: DMT family transporter [Verrucomicrobiota bacterium]|nr:DMT family transporter [Verrucomicrobiota bacterium]
MQREHHGFLMGICAALLLAFSGVMIKWGAEIPNETMVFFRFFISSLCILPFLFSGRVRLRWRAFPKHFPRAIAGLLSIYCYFYSIKYLPLVNASTLFYTGPLFVPLVVFFWLRLIVPKQRIGALVIGFLGILVILRPGPGFEWLTTLVGLLSGLFSAIAQVGIRQLSKTESTETILSYFFILSAILSFPPMLVTWQSIESSFQWLDLLGIALTSVAFQYFITKSLTHAPVSKVSVLSYLGVVFSGLFGWFIFSEQPTVWVLAGSSLIILGGLVALFSKESSRKWS